MITTYKTFVKSWENKNEKRINVFVIILQSFYLTLVIVRSTFLNQNIFHSLYASYNI